MADCALKKLPSFVSLDATLVLRGLVPLTASTKMFVYRSWLIPLRQPDTGAAAARERLGGGGWGCMPVWGF